MSKRRNANGQMRREEWEAANEGDDTTTDGGGVGFQRATDEAISRRKIVTARSSLGMRKPAAASPSLAATAAPSSSTAPAKANPFSGFQGLTGSTTTEPPAVVRANPFAGFSGLTGESTSAPSPSSLPSTSAPSASVPSTYQEAIEVLNREFLAFVTEQKRKNPCSDWIPAVQDYLRHAEEIGAKFAATKPVPMSSPVSSRATATPPMAPLAAAKPPPSIPSPVSATPVVVQPVAPAKPSSPISKPSTTSFTGFTFGAKPNLPTPSKPSPAKESAPPSTGGFSFGSSPSPSKSLFKSPAVEPSTKSVPAFSFGAVPAAAASSSSASTASSTSGFSFNMPKSEGAKPAAPASSGFSFQLGGSTAAKPFAFGATNGAATATTATTTPAATTAEDEDEETIGREEATVILKASDDDDEECPFEAEKAKFFEFISDEKRWADKGTHPLKVLVNKTTRKARVLMRNQIGKVVLNAALYKGLKVEAAETKGKKSGALMSLQVGGAITRVLLKVHADKVQELIDALTAAAG